jgi:hypothetical protein
VHNRTIGNLTARADPSVRASALRFASLEWAVGREDEASGGLLYLWSIRGCLSGERLGL